MSENLKFANSQYFFENMPWIWDFDYPDNQILSKTPMVICDNMQPGILVDAAFSSHLLFLPVSMYSSVRKVETGTYSFSRN